MRSLALALTLALLAGAAMAQPQPRYAGPGEGCNGTTWPPTLCREGLECRIPPQPAGSPPLAGAGGTCQPAPQSCNYSTFPAQTCPDNQRCIMAPNSPPGASGFCRPN